MTIAAYLQKSSASLEAAGSTSARLDALLLLADTLEKDKSWLLAHPDSPLSSENYSELEAKLTRRLQHEPMAYIRGVQEFYGREFAVDARVLIPRPESEQLITMLLKLPLQPTDTIIDVGTGSGAIAITAAVEAPQLTVQAIDISQDALNVAQANAKALGAKVNFTQGNLLKDRPANSARAIIANLPYVDPTWQRSPETDKEPALALFADEGGLALIRQLIAQSAEVLTKKGYLLLEADPRQHAAIVQHAADYGFSLIEAVSFSLCFTL